MKNLTAKETALELALMILHSIIPSKEAAELMQQMQKVACCTKAKPLAKESFEKANAIYQSLGDSKAKHIMLLEDPNELVKFREFRDHLLAISDNISENKYFATIEGWDRPREFKILADNSLAFQLTVCSGGCSGCGGRVRDAADANKKFGGRLEFCKANGGQTWVNLPDPKVGNLNKYLEDTLSIKVIQLDKA